LNRCFYSETNLTADASECIKLDAVDDHQLSSLENKIPCVRRASPNDRVLFSGEIAKRGQLLQPRSSPPALNAKNHGNGAMVISTGFWIVCAVPHPLSVKHPLNHRGKSQSQTNAIDDRRMDVPIHQIVDF
jgi:hypothetical protein